MAYQILSLLEKLSVLLCRLIIKEIEDLLTYGLNSVISHFSILVKWVIWIEILMVIFQPSFSSLIFLVFGNDGRSSETISLKNNLSDLSIVDIKLPKSLASSFAVLPPGETTLLPLFLRGDRMGKHSFKFVFGYQAEVCSKTTEKITIV